MVSPFFRRWGAGAKTLRIGCAGRDLGISRGQALRTTAAGGLTRKPRPRGRRVGYLTLTWRVEGSASSRVRVTPAPTANEGMDGLILHLAFGERPGRPLRDL